MKIQDIKVLILAAGDSSRLWPFSDKGLIQFSGKQLVNYSIDQLMKFGFKDIIVVVNEQNKNKYVQMLSSYVNKQIKLVLQGKVEGMAGAVISAKSHICGNPLLIIGPTDVYEDILFDQFKMVLKHAKDGILAGTKVTSYFPGAYLTIDQNVITGIIEKPDPKHVPSNIVNFVFDYFKDGNDIITAIVHTKARNDDRYELAIKNLIQKGYIFNLLTYTGFWGYLKYPWHILSLMSHYLQKIKVTKISKSTIASSAVIEGNVFIGEGASIMEFAKIVGPAYIGSGTVIADHTLVRESMIGKNCIVGHGSEIARSYLGDHCLLHHNYIGDSVLDDHVQMGFGAHTANLRLDGQQISSTVHNIPTHSYKTKLGSMIGTLVHIGVNTSIMPGIKIGKKSHIGSGIVLDTDIEDQKYVSNAAGTFRITDNTRV